jgi:hypothetical protein
MIETLTGLPDGIDGFRPVGTVTREDYETDVVPVLDRAAAQDHRLRVVCVVGPEFTGLAPSAVWEDIRLGLRALRRIDGCAVVTDTVWVREASRWAAFLMPCPVRVFTGDDLATAVDWLVDLPLGTGFSFRLVPDSGVAIAEVQRPLRPADIDTMAATLDEWCAEHGRLTGLVVSAPAFPGWENLAALLRHVALVASHQRRIERIAVVVDGFLADHVPDLANRVLAPEIRHFAHRDVDAALAWASASRDTTPA